MKSTQAFPPVVERPRKVKARPSSPERRSSNPQGAEVNVGAVNTGDKPHESGLIVLTTKRMPDSCCRTKTRPAGG